MSYYLFTIFIFLVAAFGFKNELNRLEKIIMNLEDKITKLQEKK